jgi:hypothetical protein
MKHGIAIFIVNGLYNYSNKIKWRWILCENILMVVLLGLFEYLFFMYVIMKYSPITDDEIKFFIFKQLLNPFLNKTIT